MHAIMVTQAHTNPANGAHRIYLVSLHAKQTEIYQQGRQISQL